MIILEFYLQELKPFSPLTGKEIKSMSVQEIIDDFKLNNNNNFYLLAPIVKDRKGEFKKELSEIKKGYVRFRINKEIFTSENLPDLKKNFKQNIEVVVDRVKLMKNIGLG